MKFQTTTRLTNPIKNLVFALALLCFLVSPLAQRMARCQEEGLDLWENDDGGETRISYLDLVKLLNENLKDAQQVNIFGQACHVGGLLKAGGKLTMPYFIAVGEKDPSACVTSGSSEKDQVPPGRLTISKIGDDDFFYYSFAYYITKELKKAKQAPTAQALFDSAADDVKKDPDLAGETPATTSGNGADAKKAINGGDKSNHALIFDGDRGGLDTEPGLERYRALADPKYGFQKDGNSLQFYRNGSLKQDYEGTKIDGPGTLANLKAALQQLNNLIKNNPKKELVNIFFDNHGYQKTALAPHQPGLDGVPKDGVLVLGGTQGCFQMPTSLAFWSDLKVGLYSNNQNLFRVHMPDFVLDVSEASTHAPIAIAIDGVALGYFDLPSNSTGAELVVHIPDSITQQLIEQSDGASTLSVTFNVTPGDYFRIATEDDILLDQNYTQTGYGLGISTSVAGLNQASNYDGVIEQSY